MKLLPDKIPVFKGILYFTLLVTIVLSTIVSLSVYHQVGSTIEHLHHEAREHGILELQYSLETFTETRLTVLSDQARLSILSQGVMHPLAMQADLTDFMSTIHLLGQKSQLALLDYRGRTIHSTHAAPTFDYQNQDWVKKLIEGSAENHVAISHEAETYFWQLAVPILYNNNPEGILVTEIPVEELDYFADVGTEVDDYAVELLYDDKVFITTGPLTAEHTMELPMTIPGLTARFLWDDKRLNSTRKTLTTKVATGILAGILVTLLLALLSADRFFIRPLKELREKAHNYAKKPELTLIPAGQRIEEISLLSTEFNKMFKLVHEREQALVSARDNLELRVEERTAELQQSRKELKKLNENLEQQVLQRTRELETAHSRMVMQEKMASVGQLAAGVAHELNNPINFVRTNFATLTDNFDDLLELMTTYRELLETLKQKAATEHLATPIDIKEEELNIEFLLEDIPVLFDESQQGFERIAKIIKSMLDFSREDQPGERSWANINKGLEDTLVIARNEYKYTADIVTDFGEIDDLFCSLQQLNQVFLNIIVNSSQAITSQKREEKGMISIRTWQDDDFIHCQISDDGPGIPAEYRQRIFEPFFTTKDPGKGTGLGLSISYDIIVRKHRGTIELLSPESGGSTFNISLPRKIQEEVSPEHKTEHGNA